VFLLGFTRIGRPVRVFIGGLFGRDCKGSSSLGILCTTLIAKLNAGSARINSSVRWIPFVDPFCGSLLWIPFVDPFKLIVRDAGLGQRQFFTVAFDVAASTNGGVDRFD
jgi:hypothetical protein